MTALEAARARLAAIAADRPGRRPLLNARIGSVYQAAGATTWPEIEAALLADLRLVAEAAGLVEAEPEADQVEPVRPDQVDRADQVEPDQADQVADPADLVEPEAEDHRPRPRFRRPPGRAFRRLRRAL